MAKLWTAIAPKVFADQLMNVRKQLRLAAYPYSILLNHFLSGSISTDDEWVPPFRSTTYVDRIRWNMVSMFVKNLQGMAQAQQDGQHE